MNSLRNLNVNIGNNTWYTEDFLRQYAKDNKEYLLHTKGGSIIVANNSGWCTLVNEAGLIWQEWAGVLQLA